MKKYYLESFLFIWLFILIGVLMIVSKDKKLEKDNYYDEKKAAAVVTNEAFNYILARKKELGIPFAEEDVNQTGLIGELSTSITTTDGILGAKRTSTDPNFAAVIIDYFEQLGVKAGDEVGMIFSGSFPALNIAALAAAEVLHLKPCIMMSIGSSSYGANLPNFTFFDMYHELYDAHIISSKVSVVSLGGAGDCGNDFDDSDKEMIINRINESGHSLFYEKDYAQNIKKRMQIFHDKTPHMKALLNIGGSLISLGKNDAAVLDTGILKPTTKKLNQIIVKNEEDIGIIDKMLQEGIPVIQVLNIKKIAFEYNIMYDATTKSEIGTGDVYYQTTYNKILPILTICFSIIFAVILYLYRTNKIKYIYRNKKKKEIE